MNRILLACNAILALLLAIRLVNTGSPALAADKPTPWCAEDLRLVAAEFADLLDAVDRPRPGGASPAKVEPTIFLLHLGAEVAPAPLSSAPVEIGLVGEPQLELVTAWQSSSILRVAVQSQLLPATNYQLRFSRELESLDGRTLPAGSAVALTTPNVQLRDVLIEDDAQVAPGRGDAGLRVRLSLPVDLAMAEQCLGLRDAETGADLPARVELVDGGAGHLFRVRMQKGELPPVVRVVLHQGCVPKRGKLPLEREQVRTIDVYEPLDLRAATATQRTLELTFNRAIPVPDAKFVTLTPACPVQYETTPRGLRIRGDFAPGTLVAVDLAPGFPGKGRSSLGITAHRTVLVPDLEPSVDILGDGEILSARAEPILTLRGCNASKVTVRLRRVYANNVVRMMQHSDARVFEPAVERELSIAMVRNVEWQERVDLREVLGGEPRGIYQVEVWREGQYWPSQRLLQITDLGVTVRAGGDRAAVQVVSIADGSPCADAQVTIVTPTNQELVTGRTDAEGKVLLPWQSGSADRKPFLVQVQHGDDRVFVGMDRCAVELAEEGLGGRAYLRDGTEAMVWPSRGIVRPGESFDIAVLVRDATGAAAVDRDLSVVFTAPGGKESRRQRIRSNGSGLFSAKLELPADAPCGRWSASVLENDAPVPGHSLALGQASFEVATFVPNRLEAVANVLGEVRHGAPLVVRVQGNWLDGTPADGRPVQVRVRLDKTAFTPKELADYSFASGIDQPPPGELPAVDAVLDEHGVAELRLQLPPQGAEQMLMATVFAEVLDPSGRPVRAQTQHLVVPDVFAVGVQVRDGHVEVRGVMADGSLAGDGPCTVRIERRHWEWRYDARGTNRWSWRSFVEKEVVHEAEVLMAGGIASMDLPVLEERGWLAAIVTHGEQRAEQVLGAAPRAPDRLRVRTTNNPAPGEMARIDVDSPAAGRGFVTLESDTVWSAHIVMLEAGDNHIEVPVPADARLPNLHAVVTLTRPAKSAKAGDGPAWLVGAADVRLRREELSAAVQLVVASEVLPQATLHVSIEAAEASLATVAVVDEGVLGVTGHASPDPLAFVLASRALTVDGADTGSRLVRDMMFVPRTKTGGDDDELGALLRGGSVDTHIRPLALFAEVPLTLGRGVVDFVLPAYEGRLRVMVIAAGPQRLGSAAAEVVVKAPLGLQVAVPRMVAPGDRFVIPVSLRNDLGKDVEVAVDIAVPESLALPGGAHYELPIAVGRTANVEVAVVAAAVEGPQSFAVTASAGGQVRTVSEVIAVRSLRLPERESRGFRLGEEQTLRVAEGWSNDRLHAEISVDVAPDRQLRPALEAMLEYPYGCCEQTASRGMALATCAALLPRLYDDPQQMPQVLPLVQAAVDRVFAMQSSLGGFGWWLGARNDDAFLTIHVMDFLVQAREVGAQLSEVGFLRAKARLLDVAAEAYDVDARCHAIEVLARLGEVVQPRLDWLCAQPVSLEARARLATALALLGERRRASDLLQHGDEAAPFAAEDNHRERLDSPIRAQALLLRAQLAIDPGHASLPGQVAALQRQLLRPRFLTTQELAQGLRALADYYRRQPVSGKAAHATVLVDGAAIPVEGGHTVDLPIHAGSTVTLAAGGEGFLLLNVQGYAPPVAHDDARMALRREIVDLETGLPTTKLRRGRVYEVRIHAELAVACRDVVVADVLPAGCEAEPVMPGDAMGGEADRDADGDAVLSDAGYGGGATKERTLEPLSREPRDDRVLMFFGAMPSGRLVLRHRIRAVFPGDYESPPVTAQGMYDATLQVSELSALRVEIVP